MAWKLAQLRTPSVSLAIMCQIPQELRGRKVAKGFLRQKSPNTCPIGSRFRKLVRSVKRMQRQTHKQQQRKLPGLQPLKQYQNRHPGQRESTTAGSLQTLMRKSKPFPLRTAKETFFDSISLRSAKSLCASLALPFI